MSIENISSRLSPAIVNHKQNLTPKIHKRYLATHRLERVEALRTNKTFDRSAH